MPLGLVPIKGTLTTEVMFIVPAPVKATVAPVVWLRLARVRVAPPPLLTELMVEPPVARVTALTVSLEATVALPRKLSVPPLSVMGAVVSLMRSGKLVPVLSRVRVPPVLTVTPMTLWAVPAPDRARVPALTTRLPLLRSTAWRSTRPAPTLARSAPPLTTPVMSRAFVVEVLLTATAVPARPLRTMFPSQVLVKLETFSRAPTPAMPVPAL